MNRYLRLIWLGLGLASLVSLVALFLLPTDWQVERRVEIEAPPERVFALLDELRAWQRWSPWQESAYPGLVFHYADQIKLVGKEAFQALGDDAVIVSQEHPGATHSGASRSGIQAVTVVPCPAALSMSSLPPRSRTRSLMLA